jgi:dihydropteroate synthase
MDRIQIVGILNVTPDSYVPESRAMDVEVALLRAEGMVRDGADIIEIGGESTGPGSADVSAAEELERTIKVIRETKKRMPNISISIDTYKASVAEKAIEAGASIVNDVTAGRGDPKMFGVAAKAGVRVVLMYAKDPTPRTSVQETRYDDVVRTIKSFLTERKQAAVDAGIESSYIILDPGLGHFVSLLPEYSFEILARLEEFADLGSPILLSPSRKSFLAGRENVKAADRLPATIAASAIAALHGASFIRTHDVQAIRRALEVVEQVR